MAKAATQSAERMSKTNVGGYFAFVHEYNKLVPLAHDLFGTESISLFQRISVKDLDPRRVTPLHWGSKAELAARAVYHHTQTLRTVLFCKSIKTEVTTLKKHHSKTISGYLY
jgi:hypothetical protein